MKNFKFPKEKEIPEDFQLQEPILQNTYLCNGEMKTWKGKTHDVFSPVCIEKKSGPVRVLVGSYPVCGAKEAMSALDAAENAYDNGRGEWPTFSING